MCVYVTHKVNENAYSMLSPTISPLTTIDTINTDHFDQHTSMREFVSSQRAQPILELERNQTFFEWWLTLTFIWSSFTIANVTRTTNRTGKYNNRKSTKSFISVRMHMRTHHTHTYTAVFARSTQTCIRFAAYRDVTVSIKLFTERKTLRWTNIQHNTIIESDRDRRRKKEDEEWSPPRRRSHRLSLSHSFLR